MSRHRAEYDRRSSKSVSQHRKALKPRRTMVCSCDRNSGPVWCCVLRSHQQPSGLNVSKGGQLIDGFAYPFASIGIVLLFTEMLICSHVVESSTHEELFQSHGHTSHIIYLQKAGTVTDQSFGSFAAFASNKKNHSVVITSRRKPVDVRFEAKTVIATFTSLFGFVLQFVGLRSMHWSATVAQLGVMITMAILRCFIRRDLAKTPKTEEIPTGFELD